MTSPAVQALARSLRRSLRPQTACRLRTAPVMGRRGRARAGRRTGFRCAPAHEGPTARSADGRRAAPAADRLERLEYEGRRYHHQMLDWVADRIAVLVKDEGVATGEIAVVAPFVSGGLRFALENRLADHGVAVRSHRPSRALREEPATLCLLTWAALCHRSWRIRPAAVRREPGADVDDRGHGPGARATARRTSRTGRRDGAPSLTSFAEIEPAMQERITFLLGGRYEGLRSWLNAHTDHRDRTSPAGEPGIDAGRQGPAALGAGPLSCRGCSASCCRSRGTGSTRASTRAR